MTMWGRHINVLMWKHIMVRKRKYICTSFELFTPIAIILLLFLLKNEIVPKSRVRDTSLEVSQTDPFKLPQHVIPKHIYYSPDTLIAGDLMDIVGQKLKRGRLFALPDKKTGYYGLPSDVNIDDLVSDLEGNDALVVFQNMTSPTLPKKLNYTIRMNKNFMTHIYQSLDGAVGPHNQFAEIYEPFVALQLAIDTSYIKMLTKEEVVQKVTFQDFPYAKPMDVEVISLICDVLSFSCSISLMLPFTFLMSNLLNERSTGQEELMKISGVSVNTLGVSHFLNVLPTGLIFAVTTTILVKVPPGSEFIPLTNPLFIFVFLVLHFISIVSMAFACSYIVKSSQHATTLAAFAYSFLWMPAIWVHGKVKNKMLLCLIGILPQSPNLWFWQEVSMAEYNGQGIQFNNFNRKFSGTYGPVVTCYLLLMMQSIVFFSIAWYLSQVRAGKYGQSKPWNFLCKKPKVNPDIEEGEDSETQMIQDSQYFEAPHKQMTPGIKIVNVSKIYPKRRALSNLSLDIYKGEITVLLGHNGAGKTTLMSIITGMTSASEGSVYVEGVETQTARDKLQQCIGYCPQDNLYFANLNILEHVIFFSMLKGASYAAARKASAELLCELGLQDKHASMGSELSGGMKRRLQLACALAGGSSVLILDEPTSGLDVETRRGLWDLLLSLRGERTVVVSTHFMEEADALGDRVAALQAGSLVCYATPIHLKKAMDSGFRLSFTTADQPRVNEILLVVTSHVPGATLSGRTLNSVTYSLPSRDSANFPALFSELEAKREELGIHTIGVGVSTLEEVFLKLCSDRETPLPSDYDETDSLQETTTTKLTGPLLYFRQFIVLFWRQLKYIWSRKLWFFSLNVILPILSILMVTRICVNIETDEGSENSGRAMDLRLYGDMPERHALLFDNSSGVGARAIRTSHPDVHFSNVDSVADAVLRVAENDRIEYNKYLVGVELTDTTAKVLYTTTVRHAMPVAVNVLTNMMLANRVPDAGADVITTYNHPYTSHVISNLVEPKSAVSAVLWALFICFIIQTVLLNHIALPSMERVSGARHLHVLAGCPPSLHWLATLAFHTLLSLLTLVAPVVLFAAVADPDHTLDQPAALGAIFVITTLGCTAVLSFIYLCSFCLSDKGGDSTILVILVFVFCFLTPTVSIAEAVLQDKTTSLQWCLSMIAKHVMPMHAFAEALARAASVARTNAYCSLNVALCPRLVLPDPNIDIGYCCATGKGNVSYFAMEHLSPGREILLLAIQTFVYMSLVVLSQRGVFNALWDRLLNCKYRPPVSQYNDQMVADEEHYVKKAFDSPDDTITDALLAHNLHKKYTSIFKKNINAVKGINFSVVKGECFGLLGVNGAGKSTTFKMLVCEEAPTRGSFFGNGYRTEGNKWQYMHSIGYCPQFSGLDEFQTGKENLSMMLTLRGFSAGDVAREVKEWLRVVGLEKYGSTLVGQYSGGCVRRAAAAAALSAGAPLTLLDEPTAGVDVAARRCVWAALKRGLRQRRSVVLTSHSMDEMEALCDRIGIMARGELCALGSPAALRAAHAAGHALALKLASGHDETDAVKSATAPARADHLKRDLRQLFAGHIHRDNASMLHYYITEKLSYSELFTRIERLKTMHSQIIEDYSLTETTLEEVFLSFARDQTDSNVAPVESV